VNIQLAARCVVGFFSVWRDSSTVSFHCSAGFLSAGQAQVQPRRLLVRRALRRAQWVASVISSYSFRYNFQYGWWEGVKLQLSVCAVVSIGFSMVWSEGLIRGISLMSFPYFSFLFVWATFRFVVYFGKLRGGCELLIRFAIGLSSFSAPWRPPSGPAHRQILAGVQQQRGRVRGHAQPLPGRPATARRGGHVPG